MDELFSKRDRKEDKNLWLQMSIVETPLGFKYQAPKLLYEMVQHICLC